jgi:hypothetical protein
MKRAIFPADERESVLRHRTAPGLIALSERVRQSESRDV